MDSADKVAIVAGGATALLGSVLIASAATPVAWAALAYGTYQIAKRTHKVMSAPPKIKSSEDDSWYGV
jgi:hypothetical protein